MIKRDSNGNHLVEMMSDNHTDRKGSDWIDIIRASFDNAFANAELYRALVLWSDIEKQLGNPQKAAYYGDYAEKLKASFNKPNSQGGFWDEGKLCYIHWRDKDNSIHGNNLVTPVNFMAVAYDICDDQVRVKNILDQIETQMQKEKLFFFLAGHSADGLAFQRYVRLKQDGLGDDILSGNSMAVIGLYQSICGINPLHNRFYLDPHITDELAGTELHEKQDLQTLAG